MRECCICGGEFKPLPRSRAKACSPECRREQRRAKNKAAWQEHVASRSVVIRACEHCGEDFSPRSKTTRFCSIGCQSLARASRRVVTDWRPCYKCGEMVYRNSLPGWTVCESCRVQTRRENDRRNELNRTWRKYGISPEDYERMLADQGGRCAICGTTDPSGGTRRNSRWCIDHDHECCPGAASCGNCVRGLLCARCNTGIGWFNDSPATLLAAADYVTRATVKA